MGSEAPRGLSPPCTCSRLSYQDTAAWQSVGKHPLSTTYSSFKSFVGPAPSQPRAGVTLQGPRLERRSPFGMLCQALILPYLGTKFLFFSCLMVQCLLLTCFLVFNCCFCGLVLLHPLSFGGRKWVSGECFLPLSPNVASISCQTSQLSLRFPLCFGLEK